MGILQKLSTLLGISKEMNVEEYMASEELEGVDILHEGAEHFVKPIALEGEADAAVVEAELGKGNIVLLNFSRIAKQPTRLKTIVGRLREYSMKINGDIARIGNELLLLTPEAIKIIKKRKTA